MDAALAVKMADEMMAQIRHGRDERQKHSRARLAYWLRAKRRALRDAREFDIVISGEILAIYAVSIRYWSGQVERRAA